MSEAASVGGLFPNIPAVFFRERFVLVKPVKHRSVYRLPEQIGNRGVAAVLRGVFGTSL